MSAFDWWLWPSIALPRRFPAIWKSLQGAPALQRQQPRAPAVVPQRRAATSLGSRCCGGHRDS